MVTIYQNYLTTSWYTPSHTQFFSSKRMHQRQRPILEIKFYGTLYQCSQHVEDTFEFEGRSMRTIEGCCGLGQMERVEIKYWFLRLK